MKSTLIPAVCTVIDVDASWLEDAGEDKEIQKAWPRILESYFCLLQRVLDVSLCEHFREPEVVSTVLLLRYIFYLKHEWLIYDSFPLFTERKILARWFLYCHWQTMEDFSCVSISMSLMQRRIWSQQYATHSHMPCNALSVGIFCRVLYTHIKCMLIPTTINNCGWNSLSTENVYWFIVYTCLYYRFKLTHLLL